MKCFFDCCAQTKTYHHDTRKKIYLRCTLSSGRVCTHLPGLSDIRRLLFLLTNALYLRDCAVSLRSFALLQRSRLRHFPILILSCQAKLKKIIKTHTKYLYCKKTPGDRRPEREKNSKRLTLHRIREILQNQRHPQS